MKVKVERQIGDGVFSFETGLLAKQADACVMARYRDTVVLNAVTSGPARPGTDFFPLTCDYRERTAAAGKFPGGFIKREGRPSTKETLTARLIDRPIRPMFAEGFMDEVQCQAMVLASDRQTDGDIIAMNGIAAGCFISPLPFYEPVASVRIGMINGEWVPFPSHDQLNESELDLIMSGTEEAVTMIEGFARQMPEDKMLEAIEFGHGVIRELCQMQRELSEKVQTQKVEFKAPEGDGLLERLASSYYEDFKNAKRTDGKQARAEAVSELKSRVLNEINPNPEADDAICSAAFEKAWHDLEYRVVRDLILSGTRPDGRDTKTVRDIYCEVDLLPCVHGSALFQRGETQAFITVALGTQRDEQKVDGLAEEYSKKFMLDYNFPSFSVGECRPIRGPGRREIGHGALAERSVKAILPEPEDFPYTIRVVSDILESNGSSSMATVCGATLGLMAAGVKITNPVAGISVGLVKNDDDWVLLTDILGDEDHFGDMDFKIAGTQNGITGIQLDLKIRGISSEIIKATLEQSRTARIDILRKMLTTIPRPKSDVSASAPRLIRIQIDPERVGMLIGPGGKTVRGIQESTNTVIEIDDEGWVTIAAVDQQSAAAASAKVEAVAANVQLGKIYTGTVNSIKDFGAFVEILPGRDGLCHISELSDGYISNVEDVCQIGDEVQVMVIEIDDHDRVKLSRRRALEELGIEDEFASNEDDGEGKEDGDRERGGDRGHDRPPRKHNRGGDRDRERSGSRGGGNRGGGGRNRRYDRR